MRIGMVCPYSFDVPGGVQAHVLQLAVPGQPGVASSIPVERRAVPFTPTRAWLVRGAGDAKAILGTAEPGDLTEKQLAIVSRSPSSQHTASTSASMDWYSGTIPRSSSVDGSASARSRSTTWARSS